MRSITRHQKLWLYSFLTFIFALALPLSFTTYTSYTALNLEIITIQKELEGVNALKNLISSLDAKRPLSREQKISIYSIGTNSTLILDPRTETYYWADLCLNFFPQIIKASTQIRAEALEKIEFTLSAITPNCNGECSEIEKNILNHIQTIKKIQLSNDSENEIKQWKRSLDFLELRLLHYQIINRSKLIYTFITVTLLALVGIILILFLVNEIFLAIKLKNNALIELKTERAKSIQSSKLACLGEMAAEIAHEINNPLAVISGSIDIIKNNKNNLEKIGSKTDTIKKQLIRIEKIIKSLKNFSRSTDKSSHKNTNILEIIQETLILTESKLKKYNIKIDHNIEKNSVIHCDALEIEQVLINLINNSIDAIKNLENKWIQIITHNKNNEIIVQIIDSGPGISAEIEKKIFQAFFTTKPIGEGTGLGLSITKGILDKHGASISINHSCPNTCFEIHFPAPGLSTSS